MNERRHLEDLPQRIVVVGGGAAGWMAAALLARCLKAAGSVVTVIEPPGQRGLGVGEATIPSVLRLLDNLQVAEAEMMRACEATYKLGIQFADWVRLERDSWHPFGVCGARIDGRDLFPYWHAERLAGRLLRPYHSYSVHWAAALAGKGPHAEGGSPISHTRSYAFHLDAVAFATFLRARAIAEGAEAIDGSVASVSRNSTGGIAEVKLDDGRAIPGELFIDCTGFQAQLIGEVLGDPFISWNDRLLCDRAVATRIPAARQIAPFTRATALSAGWHWTIPLVSRTGVGYVYSSRHTSDDEAWNELREATGDGGDPTREPLFLRLRVGRQTTFWKANVVALGLAAGFIEPLESTGLHLTQVAIELLLDLLPDRHSPDLLREAYNRRMTRIFDEVRDFVQLHYLASGRRDTPFWQDATAAAASDQLVARLAAYDECGWLEDLVPEAFPDTSWFHILAGNGRLPRRPMPLTLAAAPEQVQTTLAAILRQNEAAVQALLPHGDLLAQIHGAAASRSAGEAALGRLI
jgi:tryptophan 7-halogenase